MVENPTGLFTGPANAGSNQECLTTYLVKCSAESANWIFIGGSYERSKHAVLEELANTLDEQSCLAYKIINMGSEVPKYQRIGQVCHEQVFCGRSALVV